MRGFPKSTSAVMLSLPLQDLQFIGLGVWRMRANTGAASNVASFYVPAMKKIAQIVQRPALSMVLCSAALADPLTSGVSFSQLDFTYPVRLS